MPEQIEKTRKGVLVQMDPETHKNLKMTAIQENVTLQELVSSILNRGLNQTPARNTGRGRGRARGRAE